MKELIEQLKEERDGFLKLPPHSNIQERTENCFGSCIEIAERMLQKEKDVMCDFAKCCTSNGSMHEIDYIYDELFNAEEK